MTTTIIYPIFKDCCDYILDPYWKDIVEKCACNKFPKGIRYIYESSDGPSSSESPGFSHIFSIKTNKKPGTRGGVEVVNLPTDPINLAEVLLKIFREKLELYSSADLKIKYDEFNKTESNVQINLDCAWKDLKPKYIKDMMIRNYVIELAQKHSLTEGRSRKLLSEIVSCIQLKLLTNDDIKYCNKRIVSIKGVESTKTGLTIDIFSKAVIPSKPMKAEKNTRSSKLQQSIGKFSKLFIARHQAISEIL